MLEVAAQAAANDDQNLFSNLKVVAAHWHSNAQRPHLHYVLVLAAIEGTQVIALLQHLQPELPLPGLPGLGKGESLSEGFHRFELENGELLLTLCIGDRKAQLNQLLFCANTILIATSGSPWDKWQCAALALRAEPGSKLTAIGLPAQTLQLFANEGFVWQQEGGAGSVQHARFGPGWLRSGARKLTRSGPWLASQELRNKLPLQAPGQPLQCVVVGGGLAGSATAYALARRGWQVTVLDAGPHVAAEASGLPVGLLGPALANAPAQRASPLVRLSLAGVALTLQHAHRLLQNGKDWHASGLLTLKPETTAKWQAQAAWIKPVALVQAWLGHPNIEFIGNATVVACDNACKLWRLLDARGEVLAQAPLVILAAAANAQGLISETLKRCPQWLGHARQFSTLQALAGQVTWGPHTSALEPYLPTFPVNGAGHLLAHIPGGPDIPGKAAKFWLFGAGYEDNNQPLSDRTVVEAHVRQQTDQNLTRLKKILPGAERALRAHVQTESAQTWRNVRAVTRDRLPMVGPVLANEPGLWTVGAFGSRGLTWSVLCAELLAAQLHGEPLPIEANLAVKLDVR